MRTILAATNMLLLGIVFFMACNTSSNKESKISNPQKPRCPTRICNDYSDSPLKGVVSGDLIRLMSKAYADDLGKSSVNYNPASRNLSDTDALSLTFDLEKVKNFIWKIENAVCETGCDSALLGIRFYYIKYSSEIDIGKLSGDRALQALFSENKNKHSLVMVPVYKLNPKDEWYDFDFQNIGSRCNFNSLDTADLTKFRGLINDGSGDNHGGIGPPPGSGIFPTNPPE